jgi:hypothetical protein
MAKSVECKCKREDGPLQYMLRGDVAAVDAATVPPPVREWFNECDEERGRDEDEDEDARAGDLQHCQACGCDLHAGICPEGCAHPIEDKIVPPAGQDKDW